MPAFQICRYSLFTSSTIARNAPRARMHEGSSVYRWYIRNGHRPAVFTAVSTDLTLGSGAREPNAIGTCSRRPPVRHACCAFHQPHIQLSLAVQHSAVPLPQHSMHNRWNGSRSAPYFDLPSYCHRSSRAHLLYSDPPSHTDVYKVDHERRSNRLLKAISAQLMRFSSHVTYGSSCRPPLIYA
ncbi:hypothetical protein FKP32DRAFT_1318677 [Trametes sanguinea]|nr:hypothetical protein FKP32DRAFT_1318677 [Trametes sanguinea]